MRPDDFFTFLLLALFFFRKCGWIPPIFRKKGRYRISSIITQNILMFFQPDYAIVRERFSVLISYKDRVEVILISKIQFQRFGGRISRKKNHQFYGKKITERNMIFWAKKMINNNLGCSRGCSLPPPLGCSLGMSQNAFFEHPKHISRANDHVQKCSGDQ